MMPPLTERTRRLLTLVTDRTARARLESLFERRAALIGPPTEKELERVRFAAIKLALEGERSLGVAEELYCVDVRDLLVNAEFATDARAHERWCEARLEES
jgi:hypothetical protein